MANVYAIASGNWSNTAIWNTGALPTAADDVFSNNFTVTVNQNIDVLSLRNTASAPIVAGGGFTWSAGGFTASITGATPLFWGAINLLTFAHNTGNVTASFTNNIVLNAILIPGLLYSGNGNLTINVPSLGVAVGNTSTLLNKTGAGTLILNGNINGNTIVSFSGQIRYVINSTNGNIIINGNVSGPLLSNTNSANTSITQTANNLTINGNITPPGVLSANTVSISFTGALLTINGNLLAGVGNNVSTTAAATITGDVYANSSGYGINTTNALTVNGDVYGGNTNAILSTTGAIVVNGNVNGGSAAFYGISAGAGIITITGNVTATTTAGAVFTTGTTIINGTITNASNGRMAIWSARLFLNPSITSMTLYTIGSLTPKVLYSEDAFPNAPSASDVRQGITYGVGGTLLGTLSMPSPSDVRAGVATDATIGTANLTTSDIFSAISAATTGVGKRLANVATTDSDGAIIAAFKP